MTQQRPQVVMATNNAHKLAEVRSLLAAADGPRSTQDGQPGIDVLALADVPSYPEPAETEPTFEGNARLKALECTRRTGLPALADDSGLEVDALNGCPGVLSARWSGGQGDAANRALLLAQLSAVPAERRGARFVCAMVLTVPGPDGEPVVAHEVRRTWPGRILTEATSADGFGYDPLFVADDAPQVDGEGLSSAQLSADEKNARSHRGQALRAMIPLVAQTLDPTAGQV